MLLLKFASLFQILHVGAHVEVNVVAPVQDVWLQHWLDLVVAHLVGGGQQGLGGGGGVQEVEDEHDHDEKTQCSQQVHNFDSKHLKSEKSWI